MDKQTFEQLAVQHRDMIYRIALNQLRSIPDAEDITQEVLLKLYRHSGSFDSPEAMQAAAETLDYGRLAVVE